MTAIAQEDIAIRVSKVNVRNGILWACSVRSQVKPVNELLFTCTTGIIALGVCHANYIL